MKCAPSIDRIREALPYGAYRDPLGPRWLAVIEPPETDPPDRVRYFTPDQIAAAIDKRCGTCGEVDDGVAPGTCRVCRNTGSAHPELIDLIERTDPVPPKHLRDDEEDE